MNMEQMPNSPFGGDEIGADVDAAFEKLQQPSEDDRRRTMEFRLRILKALDDGAHSALALYLDHPGDETMGEEMVSLGIHQALERTGVDVEGDKGSEVLRACLKDSNLRNLTKGKLIAALEGEIIGAGNDQEKISIMEKALQALNADSN